jgi:hypothetical protein
MKDIEKKVRKAFVSGQNFRPQHFQLYGACLSNAYDLLYDADILLRKDRYARGQCGGEGPEDDQVSWEVDRLSDLRTTGEMFEASGSHGSEAGLLLSRTIGEEAGDVYTEDETQNRFDKRQTHLQQETWNGGACLWQYLLHIGAG